MPFTKPARYEARKVRDWLVMADTGAIALPNFQRSYVWPNQRIADYLVALFENRPTGIFLMLQVQGELSFVSRTLKGVDASTEKAQELVLDGQQRLTSLWSALKGEADYKFYVRVEDLKSRSMTVDTVDFYSANSVSGKGMSDPKIAYKNNLVPIEILLDGSGIEGNSTGQDPDEPGMIWHWCEEACKNGDSARRMLENAVKHRLQQKLLIERELHYCVLPAETEPQVAIDIFVETNKSSATIKRFDIVVALAQGKYGEDLRNRIVEFQSSAPVTTHYFSRDDEKMIPEIGEWLLKVACLKVRSPNYENGLPPKEQNFSDALDNLFVGGATRGMQRLDDLQRDLEAALTFAAQHGGTTERTLPSWPPVHVIAALQSDLRAVSKPAWRGTANRMISAYLWRAFLTDRYEAQANNRLFADFVGLRKCLKQIERSGSYTNLPPIFDDEEYPPPTAKDLAKSLQWINRGRLGPAVAAVAMRKTPMDWVTGEKLDENTVRDLEDRRKLDRHHVFPKGYLRDHVSQDEINHGLNGVLLSKEGNISLGNKAPDVYLKRILNQSQGLREEELKERVESHLVPYDTLFSQGTPKSRYTNFIKQRAKLMTDEITGLVKP